MQPMFDPYSVSVYSADASNVETVIVNGKMIVEDKKLLTYDEEKNRKAVQEYEYNEYGDPILFKKIDGLGETLIHWVYEYRYDRSKRKTMMKISDLGTDKETIMKYEY